MKFTCTQENLNKGLMIVNHIATKNTTLPILNNVLLRVENGVLKLATTNLEIGINSIVRGRAEKEGSFTVAAKLLTDYVNLLPHEQIILEVTDNFLRIECNNHKTKINGVSAEEFPVIPQIEKENFATVKVKEMKKALTQVSFAAANDDTRPEVSGVFFHFGENLVLAATDSYRLAEKKITLDKKFGSEISLIVPIKTIGELIRSLGDGNESDILEIILSDNQIKFSFAGTEIISRLIEGQYPDYKQIIPPNYKTTCSVSVTSLSNLVKSASLFCRLGLNDIILEFDSADGKVTVRSSNSHLGENVSKIDTQISGDSNQIVFNFRYLLDGLSNIDTSEVELNVIDSNTPGMLKPKGQDDYIYIIMPIKQ